MLPSVIADGTLWYPEVFTAPIPLPKPQWGTRTLEHHAEEEGQAFHQGPEATSAVEASSLPAGIASNR